jgi:hypothetical protein
MRISLFLLSTLWTRVPFIKDSNLPSCINCVHFIKYDQSDKYTNDLGKCSQFGKKNIISGEITYDYASLCRIDRDRCGQTGKYYVLLPMSSASIEDGGIKE